MPGLPIITLRDPQLRVKSTAILKPDLALRQLAHDMFLTMRFADGIGLAAPQVGRNIRLFIAEFEDKQLVSHDVRNKEEKISVPRTILLNPKITRQSKEEETLEEGCLSLPGLELPVKRAKEIHVFGETLDGKRKKIRAKGLYARVLQHEIDHLDGQTILDRCKTQARSPKKGAPIVFWGGGLFSVPIFAQLYYTPFRPQLVVTESPKPAGRNQEAQSTWLAVYAREFGAAVEEPADPKQILETLRELKPTLMVLTDYGKILPKSVFGFPKLGTINIHPSLLPKYRGPTPIQTAILEGTKETGITFFRLDKKVDHGPVLAQMKVPIAQDEDASHLRQRLARLSARVLLDVLPKYMEELLKPTPQEKNGTTYTKKFRKNDGLLNPADSPETLDRTVRALKGWPGTYFAIDGKRLIVHHGHLAHNHFLPDFVQPEGGRLMTWEEYVRGHPLPRALQNLTNVQK